MKNRINCGTYINWLRENKKWDFEPNNPYLYQAAEMRELIYTAQEVKSLKGDIFPVARKNVVEIGCYKGDTLKELAINNGDFNFVGLDIKYKRVVKSSIKIEESRLQNVVTSIADAVDFFEAIPTNWAQGTVIFYPDPWSKDSQKKNRLLNYEFLKLMKQKLIPGGFIWFKTDNFFYFEETMELFKELGFKIENPGTELPVLGHHETYFEKMFREQGETKKELIVYS